MGTDWFAAVSLVKYQGRWVLMYRWTGEQKWESFGLT